MRRTGGESGFTMVEVSTVLVIIGILAAIAIPTLISFMPRIRLASATQTLSNEIAMLRMSAIARSADAQVTFNPAANSYSLSKVVDGTPYVTTSVANFADMENLTWLDGTSSGSTVKVNLYSSGTTSVPLQRQALAVTLATKDGVTKKRVLIWSSGRVQSQKWAGGTAWVED